MRGMRKIKKLMSKFLKNAKKQIKKLAKALGFNKKQTLQIVTNNSRNLVATMENYRQIAEVDQNFNFNPGDLNNITWSFLNNDISRNELNNKNISSLNNDSIYETIGEPIYETIDDESIYETIGEPIYENIPFSKNNLEYNNVSSAKSISKPAQLGKANIKDIYQLMTENEGPGKEENSFER